MDSQNSYLTFLKAWSWLIVLGIIVALAATYIALSSRPDLYRSTATLQIGRTLESQSPGPQEIATTERLVIVYGELASRDPVLNAVTDTLELGMSAEQIRERMLVQPSPATQLIDISVIDVNPQVAAAIANEIARQLALAGPGPQSDLESQSFLQEQLDDLQRKIIAAQDEIESVEQSLLNMTSAADIYNAQLRLEVLHAQVESWQTTYGRLLAQLEPSATNTVRIIVPADPASAPMEQRTNLYYGFAVVMGGGLAALLALGLSEFDRSLRSGRDTASLDGHQPAEDVPHFRKRRASALVAMHDPESDAASAYRVLRNKVALWTDRNGPQAIVVTSTRVGEGKTTTVANLGIALANSGRLVFLVDANLHNPELDELFGYEARQGFSEILLGLKNPSEVLIETEHPYLWLIGAGGIPPNYLDVLASDHAETVVSKLLDQADIVLFDTPALSQEQESQLLAKTVGQVILIAESAHTTTDSLAQACELVTDVGASINMIVFNKVRKPWHARALPWPWSREQRLERKARERRRRRMAASASASEANDLATINPAD